MNLARRLQIGLLALLAPLGVLVLTAPAQDQLEFPEEVRVCFRNPDGSCVQCSIGMVGVWQNCPEATYLLWNTEEYGNAVRGGSNPSRVEAYCDARKIAAWNITGRDSTFKWLEWCGRTGRMAAIGAAPVHFQTFVWYDPQKDRWYVCNNNSPKKIDEYTPAGFRQLHLSSGAWIVVLKSPPPAAYPEFVAWWQEE